MKKIGKWIYCDDYLFDTETKQFVDTVAYNIKPEWIGEDFLNSEKFANILAKVPPNNTKKIPANKILVVEVTDKCNYACNYCFEGENGQNSNVLNMDVVSKEIKAMPEGSQIRFFGGEPLLEFPLIEKVVDKFPNYKYSLVTNGSLLTEEMAKFFLQHNFSMGLSYDGKHFQERNRHSSTGNSADEFKKAVEILNKAGLKFGITTVVTKESIPFLCDIHFEISTKFNAASWAYLIGYSNDLTLADLDIFKKQLFTIIDYFPAKHLTRINDLKKWSMKVSGEWSMESFCGAGMCYRALSVKGDSLICPFFLREGQCYNPSIYLEEVDCNKCYIWKYCYGGCFALNMFGTGSTHKSHPFSCKKNHIYFEAGIKTRIKMIKEIEKNKKYGFR